MTFAKCARHDCDNPARPNGWFCSDACRARTWREAHPGYTPPPSPKQRQNGAERRYRGGDQVAVGRLLEVLRGPVAGFHSEESARAIVVEAASERTRLRLVARWQA